MFSTNVSVSALCLVFLCFLPPRVLEDISESEVSLVAFAAFLLERSVGASSLADTTLVNVCGECVAIPIYDEIVATI